MIWFVAAWAVCPEPALATLGCGDSATGQLDAGAWVGTSPPETCDSGFTDLNSDLGAEQCAGNFLFPGFCIGFPCSSGSPYSSNCNNVAPNEEGPEDIYDFVCPSSGTVQLDLIGIDCDLDLFLLPDSCDPAACSFGSTNGGTNPEGGITLCIPGETYHIIVEGFGFTSDGHQAGGADYCNTHDNPRGNYTLTVTCTPDVAVEDCDTVGDEDHDGNADCEDPDCFDEAFCCDDDGDGFEDLLCGGGDCDDTVFNVANDDTDSDGFLDACDVCPDHDDPGQEDSDNDGYGDACDICPGVDDDIASFEDYWPDLDDDGYGDPLGVVVSNCTGAPPHTSTSQDDCNDTSSATYPGASEVEDGQDNDCDGTVDEDTARSDDDGDGFSELGGDCDDGDPTRFPTAVEACDGIDANCDGLPDDGTACFDDDDDGYCEGSTCTAGLPGDCNDNDPNVNPGMSEVQGNGLDDDCDGTGDSEDPDPDGDGVTEAGGDCAPNDATVHPGAAELENGIDDDCDGLIDEGSAAFDDDGDGASEIGGDCNDADPAVSPAATELENGVDDDCDGLIDEGTHSGDDDGDGFTENGGDCDDSNPNITPGASELDNGIDDDCDGQIDEGLADRDRDGYSTDDCDDEDGFVNPGITEICDLVDNNCDGTVDEGCDEDTDPPPLDSKSCATGPRALGFHALWSRR